MPQTSDPTSDDHPDQAPADNADHGASNAPGDNGASNAPADHDQGPATRGSWNVRPLPERRAQLAFRRAFSTEEYERARRGLVPREMEDKWFVFLEDDWLYFLRSWTGTCIYALRLLPIGEGHRVSEAWVNRDPAEYRMTDDAYDAGLLHYLIDTVLLGKTDVPRPVSPLNRPQQ